MTITTTHTSTAAIEEERTGSRRTLGLLAGLASISAPLLFVAGAATSPPQEDASAAAYIASLAEDPFVSGLSANLFHYSWVLFAFAAIASIGLVRGRRGRALATVGGLAGAFGAIQFTGLLYSDWVLATTGNVLTMDQAVAVFEGTNGAPSMVIWLLSAKVCGLLGFPVMYAGLARAGVLSWWLVPLSLLPMIAFGVLGGAIGIALATACYAPSYVAGLRLIQRARLAG
ncbi:hypothetical protein [Nocardioides bigeumensis]|uniref:DUF4386 family protein n=1 Tax=Nocardioides bigeumensis TaxID=433657 RepID=A0ABP5J8I1_9ACTN